MAGAVAVCSALVWLGAEGIAAPGVLGWNVGAVLLAFTGSVMILVRGPVADPRSGGRG